MTPHTRRAVLVGCGVTAASLLSGCLFDGERSATESPGELGDSSGTGGETPSPSDETGSSSGGAHGDPYPVTIRVRARPVDEGTIEAATVTVLAKAELTDEERDLLVDVVERGETDAWSGQSDEAPPERLRTLVTLTDRLPPSPAERDPEDAWRYARDTTAYVEYENTTYAVEMIKVAP